MTFAEYYENWIIIYKKDAVRPVTYQKYQMSLTWLKTIAPELELKDLDRMAYQQLINKYAEAHERQTTMDWHHQLKSCILDAVDEGLCPKDPTRRIVIKGKAPREKKPKYLNKYELKKLLDDLELGDEVSWDYLILLIAKTGMRFSEALAITPGDFDFKRNKLKINKTWDYKSMEASSFSATKNLSSIRTIAIDFETAVRFQGICKDLPEKEAIFPARLSSGKTVYNSTGNTILERHCKKAGISVITLHGLRHTHASLMLYAGANMASISQRLGHSSINITQKVYSHQISELEMQDTDIMMRALGDL